MQATAGSCDKHGDQADCDARHLEREVVAAAQAWEARTYHAEGGEYLQHHSDLGWLPRAQIEQRTEPPGQQQGRTAKRNCGDKIARCFGQPRQPPAFASDDQQHCVHEQQRQCPARPGNVEGARRNRERSQRQCAQVGRQHTRPRARLQRQRQPGVGQPKQRRAHRPPEQCRAPGEQRGDQRDQWQRGSDPRPQLARFQHQRQRVEARAGPQRASQRRSAWVEFDQQHGGEQCQRRANMRHPARPGGQRRHARNEPLFQRQKGRQRQQQHSGQPRNVDAVHGRQHGAGDAYTRRARIDRAAQTPGRKSIDRHAQERGQQPAPARREVEQARPRKRKGDHRHQHAANGLQTRASAIEVGVADEPRAAGPEAAAHAGNQRELQDGREAGPVEHNQDQGRNEQQKSTQEKQSLARAQRQQRLAEAVAERWPGRNGWPGRHGYPGGRCLLSERHRRCRCLRRGYVVGAEHHGCRRAERGSSGLRRRRLRGRGHWRR